jgi:hypothetical protein
MTNSAQGPKNTQNAPIPVGGEAIDVVLTFFMALLSEGASKVGAVQPVKDRSG